MWYLTNLLLLRLHSIGIRYTHECSVLCCKTDKVKTQILEENPVTLHFYITVKHMHVVHRSFNEKTGTEVAVTDLS